jgi:uncharacterized protein YybS (DUF2232 family)
LRRIEWLFVFLFIASGLYCLAIPAGIPMFQLPLPEWVQSIRPYLRPFVWILIVVGILTSLWSIWITRKRR